MGDKEKSLLYAYQTEYKDYDIKYEELKDKLDDKELKIKFNGKNTFVIGNPEGMNIKEIIKNKYKQDDNIIVLGNIIGSTFSKNPIIKIIPGDDDKNKLLIYYSDIIENKSYNDANIKLCNKPNIIFLMGNKEIDLIKIKKLVSLDGTTYGDFNKYLEDREKVNFEVDNMKSFYPFWVKYYYRDSYQMPKKKFYFY